MNLLWIEDEQWWGKRYLTRVGHVQAIAYENPQDNGQPTVVIKYDGKIDRVGLGHTLISVVEMAEKILLERNKNERAAA